MWGEISTPMTWRRSVINDDKVETSYGAIGIVLSHFNCPRSCTISTVQDTFNRVDRWEDQPAIEDNVEHLVLSLESVRFFLRTCELFLLSLYWWDICPHHRQEQGELICRLSIAGSLVRG